MSTIDVSELEKRKSELCLSCMECCKWLRFDCMAKDKRQATLMAEFYKTRGCDVKLNKISQMYTVIVNVPVKCPYLTEKGCSIYENRPNACRNYDGRKDVMIADKCKWNELEE